MPSNWTLKKSIPKNAITTITTVYIAPLFGFRPKWAWRLSHLRAAERQHYFILDTK